jgi:type II secretory pathway pseudopilin PulG
VNAKLRSERGMGLIELLIALTVLQIAIFAMFAMLQAGGLAILRASRTSAATAVGEKQMELYRGLLYRDTGLDTSISTDALHQSDAEWNGGAQVAPSSTWCGTSRPECTPVQTVAGPDGNQYRIDSYVHTESVSSGRDVKRVAVVVRRANDLSVPPLARLSATYDLATGCIPGDATNPC